MFGYVKPYTPQLLVREHELYKAIYCGLCRSMSKNTGCLSCLGLSYDFVFLATVRMIAEGERPSVIYKRCIPHPIKKRAAVSENSSLVYCAAASAALKADKLKDDLNDERGFKKLAAAILLPEARHAVRRSDKLQTKAPSTASYLSELSELEAANTPSLDQGADRFGELLGSIFSYGLDRNEALICMEIGRETGRFIYALDAARDLGEDVRDGKYNPIYALWGSDAYDEEKKTISKRVASSVYTSLLVSLSRLGAAIELLDASKAPELIGIVKNIAYLGMPHEAELLVTKTKESKDFSPT